MVNFALLQKLLGQALFTERFVKELLFFIAACGEEEALGIEVLSFFGHFERSRETKKDVNEKPDLLKLSRKGERPNDL